MKYVGSLEMWRWRRMKFSWTDNVREEKVLRGVWVERNMCFWRQAPPPGSRAPSFTWFLDHTQRRTTVGRTPLDKRTASRRDLYLTTHNTNNRQTSMPPVGFEYPTHNKKKEG